MRNSSLEGKAKRLFIILKYPLERISKHGMTKTFCQDNKATCLFNSYFHLCNPNLEIIAQQKGMHDSWLCLDIVIYHNFIKLNHSSFNKRGKGIHKKHNEKIKTIYVLYF